jgi:hypothetical protein
LFVCLFVVCLFVCLFVYYCLRETVPSLVTQRIVLTIMWPRGFL